MPTDAPLPSIEVKYDYVEYSNRKLWEMCHGNRRLREVVSEKAYLSFEEKLLKTITYTFQKDKNPSLGFTHRRGLVTRVNYTSPLRGSLHTGDIILLVNNIRVTFDEKPEMEKTAQSISQPITKPVSTSNSKMRTVKEVLLRRKETGDFKEVVTSLMNQKGNIVKLEFLVVKVGLQNNIDEESEAGLVPTRVPLIQYKHMKLGLNVIEIDRKVIVHYTIPDTIAAMYLSTGEVILEVNGVKVHTLEDVRKELLERFSEYGRVELRVDYPCTEEKKNMIRKAIETASKDLDRPQYIMCDDVKQYMEEGIEVLKQGKEPVSIWKENKTKVPVSTDKTSTLGMNEKANELTIPCDWNTDLYVPLPPMKTKQSEMALRAPEQQQATAPPDPKEN